MAQQSSKAATAAAAETSALPKGNQVLIRMYGQGLGDCFLLAFPRKASGRGRAAAAARGPVYVLIDCGVVGGTPDGPERMRRIVEDIRATTGNHLDLLVITHEHWDHLSGFVQAPEQWKDFPVDALWTAWTEKKDDPSGLPDVLKKILAKQKMALAAVAERSLRFGLSDRNETLLGLLSFLADSAPVGLGFAAAGVGDAFDAAKKLVAEGKRVCCEPGEVRAVPGTDAVAYVLGPPRNDARLRQIDATRNDPETYEDAPAPKSAEKTAAGSARGLASGDADATRSLLGMSDDRSGLNAFAMPFLGPALSEDALPASAAAAIDPLAEQGIYDRSFPFDRSIRVAQEIAEAQSANDAANYPALHSYFDPVNAWRRIDSDWLSSAEAFALQADNLTNNTSLVLAFELPPSRSDTKRNAGRRTARKAERKVLLFVGDAQVGNWLSWDEIPAWQKIDGAKASQEKPDIAELLKRAVFYKVGHHGSHNATLKEKGVERMPADGTLTAFVPVSVKVARDIKDWCRMPLDVMLTDLSKRTGGRVVLPNGKLWPIPPRQEAESCEKIGVKISTETLPPKVRDRDNEKIEGEVPLWVQIAIDY